MTETFDTMKQAIVTEINGWQPTESKQGEVLALYLVLCAPRNEWGEVVDRAGHTATTYADDLGSSAAVLFAEAGEYCSQRTYHMAGHEAAMNATAKLVKKVRRALGYTYP